MTEQIKSLLYYPLPRSLLFVAHIHMKLDIKYFSNNWPTYAP